MDEQFNKCPQCKSTNIEDTDYDNPGIMEGDPEVMKRPILFLNYQGSGGQRTTANQEGESSGNHSTTRGTNSLPRERPILMSAPMVRAILENRKTQMRHIVKSPSACAGNGFSSSPCQHVKSPYGVGDRLWVRETWRCFGGREYEYQQIKENIIYRATADSDEGEWRSAIFMPRWASRLSREVTDVRVERLQDISDEDADAEGFGGDCPESAFPEFSWSDAARYGSQSIIDSFAELWDLMNGKRAPWASNPLVGVVSFQKVTTD